MLWSFYDEEFSHNTAVYVVISTALTSYSRAIINKTMMDVLPLGGDIYYTAIDNIVRDIWLLSDLLDSSLIGNG